MAKSSKPELVSQSDEYERRYMNASSAIARSRMFMPWYFHVVALGALCALLYHQESLAVALTMGPAILLTWLLFMSLRVLVTPAAVHVQLGLFGPKIPIQAIVEARDEAFSFLKYRGWGIRRGLDGSLAYCMPSADRGLLIRYTNKRGKIKTVFVSAQDPQELLAAIAQARAGAPHTRIAVESETAAPEVIDDEANDGGRESVKRRQLP